MINKNKIKLDKNIFGYVLHFYNIIYYIYFFLVRNCVSLKLIEVDSYLPLFQKWS